MLSTVYTQVLQVDSLATIKKNRLQRTKNDKNKSLNVIYHELFGTFAG